MANKNEDTGENFESAALMRKKAKLGIWFFFIYLFLYAGFVIIGVFDYELLSIEVVEGLNLAILYGVLLIVFAIVMGVLYNYYCTKFENEAFSPTYSQNKKSL